MNLTYVAFLNQWPSARYVHAVPAEYAEFIFAAFVHLRDTFGFVPAFVVSAQHKHRESGIAVLSVPGNSLCQSLRDRVRWPPLQ